MKESKVMSVYPSNNLPVSFSNFDAFVFAQLITYLEILVNGIFSVFGISISFTMSWELGIFLTIMKPQIPLNTWGKCQKIPPISLGSVKNTKKLKPNKPNSAHELQKREVESSWRMIWTFIPKSKNYRAFFTFSGDGRNARASIAPDSFSMSAFCSMFPPPAAFRMPPGISSSISIFLTMLSLFISSDIPTPYSSFYYPSALYSMFLAFLINYF